MSPLPEQHPVSPAPSEALIHELLDQYRQMTQELEQAVWGEAQTHVRLDELQVRFDRLQQLYNDLQLAARQAENSARDARMEADALKIRLAYAEDIIHNLNQSLTWCQNKAWEIMSFLREYMHSPHHRLGRAWQVVMRDKVATLKAAARWIQSRLLRRPYSLAKALPARYEVAEMRESLEVLAFYARDAQRHTSHLPITTPTSMAARTLSAARRPRPDLIVYSITHWNFRQQRPQHIVNRLVARGSRAFVMPTDIPGLGEEHPSDEQILAAMKVSLLTDNIWEVVPCAYNTLNIYRDSLTDPRDLAILERSLALLRDRFGIGRHVGLVQLPFWGPLAFSLPGARVVYDCMDNHRDFSTNDPAMLEHEDRLIAEASAVVVSSTFLDEAVGDRPRAKALIRNGCEYEVFSTAPELFDPTVATLEGPMIGYYGAISDWFDVELVEAVARRRPDWHFVLIGHTFGAKIDGLKALSNVIFTGEVAYKLLTSYLYRFDVCMIPFKLTELILATNPVKIYEYAAAGKPTVATRIPEVERLGDLAAIADNAVEFEKAIERLLAEPDPAARAERLRAFARENTWDARAEAFDAVLRRHAWPKVSVVVLSYNNWPLTRDCLLSIIEQTTYPNFELIVVDNASDAETQAQLRSFGDPRLKIHFNEANLGYAGGNNCGARMSEGEFIILLNNDTVCPPDWIERLLAPFKEDARVGLVSPMTNSAGNEQMLDVFCHSDQDQRLWLREFYRVRQGRRHEPDRLGFFCVAIRREAWESIGELDAGFEVGFFEDDDYCARAVEAGWKLAVAEDAFVYHHGSASFNKLEKPDRRAIEEKNRARFEAKHNRPWQLPIREYLHYGPDGPGDEARPVAVLAGGGEWNSPVERPQQFALALVRAGWRVYYLTENQAHDRFQGIRLVSPFLYVAENAAQWIDEIAHGGVQMFLSFGPRAEDAAARVKAESSVVDLGSTGAWAWRAEDAAFSQAACGADRITLAHPNLHESLPAELRAQAVEMPGGVEPDHFQRETPLVPPAALETLLKTGAPLIAILGSLASNLDWTWLEALARPRRDWSFVFIDSTVAVPPRELPEFFNLRNAHLVTGTPYADLPDVLAFMAAGVVPPSADLAALAQGREAALAMIAAGLPVAAAVVMDGLEFDGLTQDLADPATAASALREKMNLRHDTAFRRHCAEFVGEWDWQHALAPLLEFHAARVSHER